MKNTWSVGLWPVEMQNVRSTVRIQARANTEVSILVTVQVLMSPYALVRKISTVRCYKAFSMSVEKKYLTAGYMKGPSTDCYLLIYVKVSFTFLS